MRYRDDSPMPSRAQISDVDVLVSPYSRVISRFSAGLNLGRREPRAFMTLATGAWACSADAACTSSTIVNGLSFHYQRSPRRQSPIVVGGRRAQILGVLSRARMSLAHYEIIVDAGSSDVCVENDVDSLTRRQPSALETVEAVVIRPF